MSKLKTLKDMSFRGDGLLTLDNINRDIPKEYLKDEAIKWIKHFMEKNHIYDTKDLAKNMDLYPLSGGDINEVPVEVVFGFQLDCDKQDGLREVLNIIAWIMFFFDIKNEDLFKMNKEEIRNIFMSNDKIPPLSRILKDFYIETERVQIMEQLVAEHLFDINYKGQRYCDAKGKLFINE